MLIGIALDAATNERPADVIPTVRAGPNDGELSCIECRFAQDDAKEISALGTDSSKILCHLGYFFSLDFAVSALSAESFLSISSLELKNCPANGPRWQ